VIEASTPHRRAFLAGAAALGAGLATGAAAAPGSAIRYSISGQMWDGDGEVVKMWGGNIEEGIKECARMGFDGIEPFRQHVMKYLDNPAALKKQADDAGIAFSSCSNGGRGLATNFIDRSQTAQTIKDHVAFARDFILPICGPTAFKFNMGRRPDGGVMTDDHIKTVAETLNEIGRQTIQFGIKAAPHPHLWGPLEREHEVRLAMELTDPRYVFMTADTAHLTLGGMDALKIVTDYYPRIAELHYKDCLPKYRGNSQSPTPEMHHQGVGLYLDLGAGGVDLPAIHKFVLARGYKGWISLDYDAPRIEEHQTVEQKVAANKKYLVDVLKVKTLAPSHPGQSACEFSCKPPA
jgi:inosose dehydratase